MHSVFFVLLQYKLQSNLQSYCSSNNARKHGKDGLFFDQHQ
jgi:hypothetical protein